MVVDEFGITQLFATKSGAREWFNKWANGHTRVMKRTGFTSYLLPPQTNSTEYNVDPDDSELIDMADGPCYLYIDGAGVLTHTQGPSTSGISSEGNDMRLTVCDYKPGANSYDIANEVPARKTWTNVEATIYIRALTESFGATGGAIRLAGRSNHFNYRYCLCDAGGYDFQLHRKLTSSTGVLRVDKEMIHDTYTTPKTGYSHFDTCSPYFRGDSSGGVFPMNRWVGMKLILRTITPLGHVNIQGWRDLDNGLDGGKWVKMVEWTDTGTIGEWGLPMLEDRHNSKHSGLTMAVEPQLKDCQTGVLIPVHLIRTSIQFISEQDTPAISVLIISIEYKRNTFQSGR